MYLENVQGFEGDGELFSKFGFEFRSTATFVVAKRRWEESVGRNAESLQLPARPAEGDLLFFSKTKTFFEIKFVEFQNPFYQLGKIYTYKLQCEVFEFSSERIDTNIDEIDSLTDAKNQDTFGFQLLMESGSFLLNSDDDSVILEKYATKITDPLSDNEDFEHEAESILDFTAFNPFGEVQTRA
jgi:hypothetical protein